MDPEGHVHARRVGRRAMEGCRVEAVLKLQEPLRDRAQFEGMSLFIPAECYST